MAIVYKGNIAFLEETCIVEEAEEFVTWLKNTENPEINMEKMEHMHTAIFQVLLFFRPKIVKFPNDIFWRNLLCW